MTKQSDESDYESSPCLVKLFVLKMLLCVKEEVKLGVSSLNIL